MRLINFGETLIHSDLRADNLLFNTAGDGVMVVDWQGCSFGPSSFDITYHMIQSLSVDDRRQHETELLDYYVSSMESFGHQISIDEVHNLYRVLFCIASVLLVQCR
ncbi:MAG: hypothetical protein CM15mP49_34250 [Actinomycetota bacterium]|nr:MAG: hypothetical protein CM15mP49_34250 [Actinomycetota bacterium]